MASVIIEIHAAEGGDHAKRLRKKQQQYKNWKQGTIIRTEIPLSQ